MMYFTPDLYRRFNSPDEAIADQADEDWEAALRAYRDSLAPHLDAMNPRIRALAEGRQGLCFHDAELLSIQEEAPISLPSASPLPPVALVSLADEGSIAELVYFLWAPIEQTSPPDDWPFAASRTHWLYDEIQVSAGRSPSDAPHYRHEILLSDGRIVSISFFDMLIHRSSLRNREPVVISGRRA
ncbi:hypothetical protein AB1L88_22500 [Tautonia sp. JC769]|uniref:hypothetical protein n=1 Tax=Tautonia sp. JC769 TaxID=3232135 RepID=UPI003459E880